jgi:hypothetical protein
MCVIGKWCPSAPREQVFYYALYNRGSDAQDLIDLLAAVGSIRKNGAHGEREWFRRNPEGGVPFEQVVVECGFSMDQIRNFKGE